MQPVLGNAKRNVNVDRDFGVTRPSLSRGGVVSHNTVVVVVVVVLTVHTPNAAHICQLLPSAKYACVDHVMSCGLDAGTASLLGGVAVDKFTSVHVLPCQTAHPRAQIGQEQSVLLLHKT